MKNNNYNWVFLIFLLFSDLFSAALTWNVAGSGNWNTTTGNWTAGATFTDGGVDSVTFNNAAGGTITISPNMTPTSMVVSGSGTYTFSGGPIDGGTLTKNTTTGTLNLTSANAYAGGTTINAGTVVISDGSALGTNAGGTVIVAGASASLRLQNNITVTGEALTIGGGGSALTGALLNVSGNNAWTGDISVTAGSTTRITSDAGLLSLTGNITLSTTSTDQFVLGGNGDGVVSGAISGAGRLTKSSLGTGTWTLTGNNTATTLLTIANGTMVVGTASGGSWAGDVQVASGTLKGVGTISGSVTVNTGGIYSPGNSPGIQRVGSLTINSGSNLIIEIDGAIAGNGSGFHDQIQSTGSVRLNGGTLQAGTLFSGSSGFVPSAGTKLTIITGSSVTGAFSSYDYSNNPLGLSFSTEYTDTAVNLYVVPSDLGSIPGMNSNQQSIGRALQSFRVSDIDSRSGVNLGTGSSSDQGRIFGGLMRLSGDQLKEAYNQMSPEKLTAMGASSVLSQRMSGMAIHGRLDQIRQGDHGASVNGISLQNLSGDFDNESLATSEGEIQLIKRKAKKRYNFFLNTLGSYGEMESNKNRIGYENRSGGLIFGSDFALRDDLDLGVYIAQTHSNAVIDSGGGTVVSNSGRGGLYAGYHMRGFYANASVGGGYNAYDANRSISFLGETAKGSTQGSDLYTQILSGIDFQSGEWIWGPYGKMDYSYQWIDPFQEEGSSARLKVKKQEGEMLETGLGMRLKRNFKWMGYKWTPEIRVLGAYQWEKPLKIDAQFNAGGESFSIQPEGEGSERIIPGINLAIQFTESLSFQTSYDVLISSGNTTHQGSLGVSFNF